MAIDADFYGKHGAPIGWREHQRPRSLLRRLIEQAGGKRPA
jgi:hypothetical protein